MKTDARIMERLTVLLDRAEQVQSKRKPDPEYPDLGFVYPEPDLSVLLTNTLTLLKQVSGEDGEHYLHCKEAKQSMYPDIWFEACRAALLAAKDDFESGMLFHLRAMTKAEVLDDALESAEALMQDVDRLPRNKDLAAILARVALEVPLKELSERHGVEPRGLEDMNVGLRKAGLYEVSRQQEITAWAAIGNRAAHGEWDKYDAGSVSAMIAGVRRFVSDFMV